MSLILWDEHFEVFDNIPVLEQKSKTLQWFYIKDGNTYLLYHNVEL